MSNFSNTDPSELAERVEILENIVIRLIALLKKDYRDTFMRTKDGKFFFALPPILYEGEQGRESHILLQRWLQEFDEEVFLLPEPDEESRSE